MNIRTSFLTTILVSALTAGMAAGQTTSRARITGAIDEYNTVTLSGNVHPVAAAANTSERVDDGTPMERMILLLKGDSGQESQLEQLIAQQNDPKSPLYHKYLAPKDYASQFGVSQADITTVSTWLQNHGFRIEEVPAGNRSIVFSGTAGQIAETFKTEIHRYSVNGVTHMANASDPQIPAALASTVSGIVKLHDFRYGHSITTPKPVSAAELAHPEFTYGSSHYLSPADYGIIYDINPLYTAGIKGSGQTIAVLARSDIYMSDVESFRSNMGLPANNPQFIVTNSDPGVLNGDSTETTLDTEWSGAVAPAATIKVIISASTTSDGIDLSSLYAVNNNVAPIITLSYGSCEAGMGSTELAFYNNLWKQAASQGQSVMVSAGDSGAAGCDYGSTATYGQAVNGLCSSPYSTCVGGTEFVEGTNPGQYWQPGNSSTNGSVISYIPEMVWNESGTVSGGSGLWAGGGGVSITYAKPTWQAGVGVPADGKRDVPDLSLTAAGHDGYLIWLSGSLNSVGGTSAAAPSFAGMMALVDQKLNARAGLVNSVIYPLATKQAAGGAAVFHDTVMGNNSVPGQVGFTATTGYDRASGLGSVDANLLVNNWTNASTTGGSINLSAASTSVTVLVGKTGQATITSAATSVNAAVTMSVTGAPTGLTATFASATVASPGSGTDTLNFSAASTVTPGTYPLTVKAVSGSLSATVTVSVVIPAPMFTLSATAASLSVTAGNSVQTGLSATPANGFNSAVALSATSLPTGITATFSPATIPATATAGTTAGSSALTLAVAKTVATGSYTVKISATGGGVTQTASVTVVVTGQASCTLTATPTSVSMGPGQTSSVSATCGSVQGTFASPLTYTVSAPSAITAKAASSATGATITMTTASTVAAGSYSVSVTATSGTFTQTVAIPVVVSTPTFALSAITTSVSATAGSTAQASLTVTREYGFAAGISLAASGLPAGVTAAFSSGSATGTADDSALVTLTVASTAKAGASTITVTGTGGGITKTATFTLSLTVVNTFKLTPTSNTVSASAKTAGSVTLNTLHQGIFNSAISISATGLPTGVTAAFSKTAIGAPGDGSTIATFTVGSAAKAGSYQVTVLGTGGGVSQSAPITLTVTAGPSFTLSLSTSSVTVAQGSSGTITTSTGNYANGFNGQLVIAFSGLPTGVVPAFKTAGTANNMVNITYTLAVPSGLKAGTYPITITDTGNSGVAATGNGAVESATFNLVVTAATTVKP